MAKTEGSKNKCLKCGSLGHGVLRCPKASAEEANKLWSEFKKKRKGINHAARAVAAVAAGAAAAATGDQNPKGQDGQSTPSPQICSAVATDDDDSWVDATIEGVAARITLDTGADYPVVSSDFMAKLEFGSGCAK